MEVLCGDDQLSTQAGILRQHKPLGKWTETFGEVDNEISNPAVTSVTMGKPYWQIDRLPGIYTVSQKVLYNFDLL